jgi:hypothetical protein
MEFQFNPTVETLDNVPQDFRGLYAESESGGYQLRSDDEGVKSAVSAITGLAKSLKAARAEAQGWKGKSVDLGQLAEYGETPEAILEAFNEKLNEAVKGKKTQEDFLRQVEKVKSDLGAEYAQKIEAEQARAEALKNQLHGILVTGEARSALAEAGAIDADLALPFLSQQVRVAEEDGKFQVLVVDQAGDPRYSGVTGAPMSVKELVMEMKGQEKFGPLFKSESKSGAGTPAAGQRRAPAPGGENMSSTDKIAAGLAKGQATPRR